MASRNGARDFDDSLCRTCRNCRRKKVRCDYQRPICGGCRARRLVCGYPPDARTSGVRRGQAAGSANLPRQNEEISTLSRTSTSKDFDSQNTPTVVIGVESSQPSPPLTGFLQNLETRVPTLFSDEFSTIAHAARVFSPSPSESINGTPQNQVYVYGATSLLHDQPSKALLDDSDPIVAQKGRPDEAQDRDTLIANTAIRRQEESRLCSNPSILAKVDFDGVRMDLAMHLLELYWNRQHLTYLMVYRSAVMDSLVRNGPHINKLLLNAIYLSTSLYSDRFNPSRESESLGHSYYHRFKRLLVSYIDQPSIPTILALLVGGSCLVPHGKQSAGWAFCGIAYRMIVDLGCHLDLSTHASTTIGSTAIDREIRRRAFWGAFVCDKFQSLFLGRPPALASSAGTISDEYLDNFEELDPWTPYMDPDRQSAGGMKATYKASPTYAISTFKITLRLSKVAARLIGTFFSTSISTLSYETQLAERSRIRSDLSDWEASLPVHLRFDPLTDPTPPPHQITPHTSYWVLVILNEQPFLNRDTVSCSPTSSGSDTRQRCIEAALKIWKLIEAYEAAFTLSRAQYGISYAAYCAVFVILQQTDRSCPNFDACTSFFWQVLSKYRMACWPGLKKPLTLLKLLMQRVPHNSTAHEALDDRVLEAPEPRNNLDDLATSTKVTQNILQDSSNGVELESDQEWTQWLSMTIEDERLMDETVFGIFMQD